MGESKSGVTLRCKSALNIHVTNTKHESAVVSTPPFKESKMKLYEVPRNSRIIVIGDGTEYNFKRIDGGYSLCTTDKNETVHLSAWVDVEIIKENKDAM